MVSKVIIFGDSYMDGTELATSDDDLRHQADSLFPGVARQMDGSLPLPWTAPMFDKFNDWTFSLPDYFPRCKAYSMGGYLARKLNLPYENHAYGGYSNEAVMAEIWNNRPRLNGDTLVLVGLTYPNRTTRCDDTGHGGRTKTFNARVIPAQHRDLEQFLWLSTKYGDDTLTSILRVATHINALATMLRGIPYVVIDPLNIYRQNPEIHGKVFPWPRTRLVENMIRSNGEKIIMPYLVSQLQDFFDSSTFGFTLNHAMIEIAGQGNPYMEMLGHPNKSAHELFVDRYLQPHLEKEGMI